MTRKVIERLLIFFIGIPVMVASVLLFLDLHHLFFHIVITLFSILGTLELNAMLSKHQLNQSVFFASICGAAPTVAASICVFAHLTFDYVHYAVFAIFLLSLVKEIFFYKTSDTDTLFSKSASRIASTTFMLFYPAVLLTFVVRMTDMQFSTQVIILFMLLVFGCDSFAWLAGISLGAGTRGYVKASPKKSLIGFVGGIIASLLIGFLFYYKCECFRSQPLYKMLIISFTCAITAIVGDLGESVIKRSCVTKDSGGAVPGRGGIFDSIDSIIITAPVFYALVRSFYGF